MVYQAPARSAVAQSAAARLFETFHKLTTNLTVRRSTILLGPRRVGKTVMLHHFIYELMKEGINPHHILYVSIDTPVYSDMSLESILEIFIRLNKISEEEPCYVIFDEIQYLKGWEVHLKDLTDSYPQVRFIASGSAAAALRLQSRESGAGRFSDSMLPPLSFLEFVKFVGKLDRCVKHVNGFYDVVDIKSLNECFVDYINFGGFPEVALDDTIRANIDSFIKADIIDKVLLKDLPNLYGISDTQELNNIFKLLAYNNGEEVGLEAIAQQSQVSKANIKSYIEYLDSAFLISQHHKIPTSGKQLIRKRTFKVFLTNPSMRAALFSPVEDSNSTLLGHLAEAALLAQWDHLSRRRHNTYYYRDTSGNEVDLVSLEPGTLKPARPLEVKWSDSFFRNPTVSLKGLFYFMKKYGLSTATATSKTIFETIEHNSMRVTIVPTSYYCLNTGSMTSEAAMAARLAESDFIVGELAQ